MKFMIIYLRLNQLQQIIDMPKKTVRVEYTQEEINDIAFRLNQSITTIRRVGEYIVNNNGNVSAISNETFVGWGKNIMVQSDKILDISSNLWPKPVEGDDDFKS